MKKWINIFDWPIIDEDMEDVRRGERDPKIREALKRTTPFPKQTPEVET